MIKTPVAPISGLGPLSWDSVGQVPGSDKSLIQKSLSPPDNPPSVPSNRSSNERQIYSYIKWETDAAYCDLNQKSTRPGSQPNAFDFLAALKLLAHKSPNLRILELGNGQDETMRLCLEALRSDFNERLYSTYTLATTSLDTAFSAKITSKGACNVEIVFLDIDQEPENQGLENGAYDLIIVTDVQLSNQSFNVLLIKNAVFLRGKSEPDSLGRPSEISYQSSRNSFLPATFPWFECV